MRTHSRSTAAGLGLLALLLIAAGGTVGVVPFGTDFDIASDGTVHVGALTGDITKSSGALATTLAAVVRAVSSSDLVKTSDTALADVPGLSVPLLVGKTYVCTASLYLTNAAAGGVKAAFSSDGTLVASLFRMTGTVHTSATSISTTVTTLGSTAGAAAASVNALMNGTIVVSTAGTMKVQAAQTTSNGSASTVLQGSSLVCTAI